MPRRSIDSSVHALRAKPTSQRRSALTLARILAAAEALLAEDEALTMEQIAERAHVSVGAIYKRFQGKDSLLPLVLERVQDRQLQRLNEFLAQPQWADAGLGTRIAALMHAFAASQIARQRLIRALVVGHWQSPDRDAIEARSAALIGAMQQWLGERAEEIRHPEPRVALSLGLFTALQTLQTAILFERIPPQIGVPRFIDEIARMYQCYLGLTPSVPPGTLNAGMRTGEIGADVSSPS